MASLRAALWLAVLLLVGCAHGVGGAHWDDPDRPLLVWNSVGMGVGRTTVMALYPDGRMFFGIDDGYSALLLSPSEKNAFLRTVDVPHLTSGPNRDVFPKMSDIPFDELLAWPEEGAKRRSLRGASVWIWAEAHSGDPSTEMFRAAADPDVIKALDGFAQLSSAVHELRARAQPWEPAHFTLKLDRLSHPSSQKARPWPSDLPALKLECDPSSDSGRSAQITLDQKWFDRVRSMLTSENAFLRVNGCDYWAQAEIQLPGEASWRGQPGGRR